MDDVRDIQVSNFSKFLDPDVRTNPFGENKNGERAYRRAERLVAAIFLLTKHIPPSESLRQEIRSNACALLPQILDLKDEMRAVSSNKVADFQVVVRHLISQIKMLVFAGYVSAQNAEAVSGAVDELGNFIHLSVRTNLSETIRISKEELLDVREINKGHIRDIKDTRIVKDTIAIKDTQNVQQKSSVSATAYRGTSIIEVLRAGGELNIRDIASNLPEYGEKTIQRELNTLIERGLVQRIGLKRWSRYSLVKA